MDKRPRINKASAHCMERPQLSSIHQCWSMNFVSDQLFNSSRFRALTIVDNYSRKCLTIHSEKSIKENDVAHLLDRLKNQKNYVSLRIQLDNGSFRDECLNTHWLL